MKRAIVAMLPALLVAAPAAAFKRSVTEAGGDVCLYWPKRSITWHAASPLGAEAGDEAARIALQKSFAAWDSVSCTDLSFAEGGRSARDIGYDRSGGNRNVLLFRTESSCERYSGEPCYESGTCPAEHDCWDYPADLLAVTTTTFDRCGQLLDADIEFNGGDFAFTATAGDGPACQGTSTAGCVAFDVQNTATHEIGHLLGLDHPDAAGNPEIKEATMYASAASGETKKRTVEQDDRTGVCTIYPSGEPAASCMPASQCAASGGGRSGSRCATSGEEASALALALSVALLGRRPRRP